MHGRGGLGLVVSNTVNRGERFLNSLLFQICLLVYVFKGPSRRAVDDIVDGKALRGKATWIGGSHRNEDSRWRLHHPL